MNLVHGLLVIGGVAFFAEVAVSAGLGRPLHRWKDTLAAVSLNAMTGALSGVGKALLLLLYVPLYEALALWDYQGRWWELGLALVAYDFMAYWFHRWSHTTNLGWAVHVVHHQSEELNLATPMRTAPFRSFLDWPTILPLAILGVPPQTMLFLYILHVVGQVPIHTRWVPRLGPVEWVFNTPSHHRVHHGCDVGYQDANYGAHLIVWDRLFGTFVPEGRAPRYGVVKTVPGWDPLRSTLTPFRFVWEQSRGWSAWDRLRVWVMPPGWGPGGMAEVGEPPPRRTDLRPERLFATIWHTLVASLMFVAVMGIPALSVPGRVVLVGLGLWGMTVQGRVLEDGRPQPGTEVVRGVAMIAAAALMPWWLAPALIALGAVTAVPAVVVLLRVGSRPVRAS